MSKFTKAPWRSDEYDSTIIWAKSLGGCRLEESEFMLAQARGWGHLQYLDNGTEIQDANAQLISAAPDLYEACKHTVAFLDHSPENVGVMLDMLKAALAKANGRNQ